MHVFMFFYLCVSYIFLEILLETEGKHLATTEVPIYVQDPIENTFNSSHFTCNNDLKSRIVIGTNLSDVDVIQLINDVFGKGKNNSVNLRSKRMAGERNKQHISKIDKLGKESGTNILKDFLKDCIVNAIEWGIETYKDEEKRKVFVDNVRSFLGTLERVNYAEGMPFDVPYLPVLWFDEMKLRLNSTIEKMSENRKTQDTPSTIDTKQSDSSTEKQASAETVHATETLPEVMEEPQTTERHPAKTEVPQTTEEEPVTEDYSETTIHRVAEQGKLNGVKYFVEDEDEDLSSEDREFNTPLHLAAMNGHLDVVRYLLDNGANVGGNFKKVTPLHLSAQNGHLEIVKYLVEKGAKINTDTSGDITPLDLASKNSHIEIMKYLIDNGANITETSLFESVKNGHFDAAKYLVEKGANLTIIDTYSKSALCYVAEHGELEWVKYFFSKGASISYNDGGVRSVLPCAAASGNLEVVKYLLEQGAGVNVKDGNDNTPLNAAVAKGELSIVKYLVEKGAIINPHKTSPLDVAVDNGHLDIAKYLIAKGVYISPWGGLSTLFLAIKHGDLDFVKYLIDVKGTDVNVWSKRELPVHNAIERGKFDIALILLGKTDDITAKNSDGYTILHQAVGKGALNLVKFLVENKEMDVNIKTRYMDKTPLLLAVEINNIDLAKYLVEKGAQFNGRYLHIAVTNGNLPMVEFLINAGADINMKNQNGATALHLAAQNGFLDIVQYLIRKGANANIADDTGETPVARAADKCYIDIVKLLKPDDLEANEEAPEALEEESGGEDQVMEDSRVTCELDKDSLQSVVMDGDLDKVKCLIAKGANVNSKDASGLAPLHKAAIYRPNFVNGLKIVKYLVENGADVNAKASSGSSLFLDDGVGIGQKRKQGRTPLHYAAIHGRTSFYIKNGRVEGGCLDGNLDTVQYLVSKGADITVRDDDGKTPLDLARTRCNPKVIAFLSKKCGIQKTM